MEIAQGICAIVATFGDDSWRRMAEDRALPSIARQTVSPVQVEYVHGENLAQARNEGAQRAQTPYLLFVDADDELDPGFVAAMDPLTRVRGRLLNPAVQFVVPGEKLKPPRLFKPKSLRQGNFLVIGTLMPADLFWLAGGFDPKYEAYEDWATLMRIVALGAKIVTVPGAVYVAHWNGQGRNNTIPDAKGLMKRILVDFDAWQKGRE